MLGQNIHQAINYLVAFWNGVDLRFRLLDEPRLLFNIAGIIIATVCFILIQYISSHV